MMLVTIAIPTLNEEGNIGSRLDELQESMQCTSGYTFETIILDSHSTDRTVDIAREHAITSHIYSIPKGILTARDKGFRYAHGEVVIQVNADATNNKEFLPRLLKPFQHEGVVGTYPLTITRGLGLDNALRMFSHLFLSKYIMPGIRAVRKDAYFQAGPYDLRIDQDELFPVLLEENLKFPLRLRERGKVQYVPWARTTQSNRNDMVLLKNLQQFLRGERTLDGKDGGAQWGLHNEQLLNSLGEALEEIQEYEGH